MTEKMSELEELKKRVAELEKAAKPPEPFVSDWKGPVDYTQGMSMPRSAMQAMIDAVPDRLMNDLRADALKPNPMTVSGGMTKPVAPEPPKVIGKNGWIDQR